MRPRKYIVAAERLARRIRSGDYHVQGIPAERELAVELEVSHMTARKAIQKLIDDGVVFRQPNGRLGIPVADDQSAGDTTLQIAFLAPACPSDETQYWHLAVARVAKRFGFGCRLVYYLHADDPVIKNTLRAFDFSFMLPIDTFPDNIAGSLVETESLFAILGSDWTHLGVPSISMFPPCSVHQLLDHLADIGCKRIDCLNTQPGKMVVSQRIRQWQFWLDSHGNDGCLHNDPVEIARDPLPRAYQVTDQLIRNSELTCDALLCITAPAAIGAMRAMKDNGLEPGVDIAVCTADSGTNFEYLIPSLTYLECLAPDAFLEICFDWAENSTQGWTGPLLLQPENINVIVGESTVPGAGMDSRRA